MKKNKKKKPKTLVLLMEPDLFQEIIVEDS